MFCKVVQNESIYKEFLEMILADKIGKITYLASQDAVVIGLKSKSIRLDVLVKDEVENLTTSRCRLQTSTTFRSE